MAHVYVLRSSRNGRLYVGSTVDLSRRLNEHKTGQVKSTKHLRPIQLVYRQRYGDLSEARKIELKLKNLKSRKILERIICEGVIQTRA